MRGYTGAETITIDGYWKDGEGIVLAVHHAAGLTLRAAPAVVRVA